MSYTHRVTSEPAGEDTQTTPRGETIPVPARADVLRDLRKVAKADEPSDAEDGGSSGED
jgi:hypothetical protein